MGLTFNNGRNAAAMTSTSSLNVGIGTSSPNYKLQVAPSAVYGNGEDGNISINALPSSGTVTSPTTVGGIVFGDTNVTNGYLGRLAVIQDNPSSSTASHMRFYTNSGGGNGSTTEKVRITSAGNVGIGTTTVNNLLSVRGNADFGATGYAYAGQSQYGGLTFPRGQIMFSNTNTQNQLYIATNAYSNSSGVFAYRNSGQTATSIGLDNGIIYFLTAPSGTADAAISWINSLTITNAGNVGIGTTSPAANLDIQASRVANLTLLKLGTTNASTANGDQVNIDFYSYANNYLNGRISRVIEDYSTYSGALTFATGNSGSVTERMRITGSGFVYVGASSMANGQKFGITGSGVWDGGTLALQNTGTGGKTYTIFSTNDSFSQGSGNLLFYNTTNPTNCLIIYANGNYAFAGSNVSDRRLKQDITDLNFGLDEIMKLSPKSYHLKSENNLNGENLVTLKKNYGFIAQEMQDVLPEIVTGKETETEYLGLDYNSILAVAVKAIQEQNKSIQELEARIKTLENK